MFFLSVINITKVFDQLIDKWLLLDQFNSLLTSSPKFMIESLTEQLVPVIVVSSANSSKFSFSTKSKAKSLIKIRKIKGPKWSLVEHQVKLN